MTNEVLSQDEVDALLKGMNGEVAEAPPAEQQGGVREYDLATQERIVRGRMPTLEILNERFARMMRTGMFNFMRKSPEISVKPVRVVKYSAFIRNLVVPTNLNIVQLKPLRGNALFIFEPTLIFTVIDSLFGGGGRFHTRVEGRDFTATEQRIIARLLQMTLEHYAQAWKPLHPMQFEFVRAEMHTQFANIATPSEIVVATTFNIDFGGAGGEFHICIPYSSVEPIRDVLYSALQGEQSEPDKRWLKLLTKQVQVAQVELSANLATIPVNVRQLVNMKPGDVVGFELPSSVVAEVDGVPIFECRYGTMDGRYALKVEKILSSRDNLAGDEHVK
jgi:flagellar motor switch protein FliM